MPIYEYQCENCTHKLEIIQKVTDSPLTTCPECGKKALHKLVSAAAFMLKGTGWYVTDFRDKSKPKGDSKAGESPPAGDSDKPKDKKSDTDTKKSDKKETKASTPSD